MMNAYRLGGVQKFDFSKKNKKFWTPPIEGDVRCSFSVGWEDLVESCENSLGALLGRGISIGVVDATA
jgi:hypothetical protein